MMLAGIGSELESVLLDEACECFTQQISKFLVKFGIEWPSASLLLLGGVALCLSTYIIMGHDRDFHLTSQ
jgi:hypothetical protein